MSTHIDGLDTSNTFVTVTTNDALAKSYSEHEFHEDDADSSVLALEAPGNCHLVIIEGDLEVFARRIWQAAFPDDDHTRSVPNEDQWEDSERRRLGMTDQSTMNTLITAAESWRDELDTEIIPAAADDDVVGYRSDSIAISEAIDHARSSMRTSEVESTVPVADLPRIVTDPNHGVISLIGDRGNPSLITGHLRESSLVKGALSVETEHGTVYLDLESTQRIREEATTRMTS